MLKLANQTLDVYDDLDKSMLKKLASKMPNVNVLTPEERANLRDDQFALCVITKTASKINKYPIADPDSTILSQEYFLENGHKLPKTAAVIAAGHIKQACEQFGLEAKPQIEKLASEGSFTTNVYHDTGSVHSTPRYAKPNLEKIANVAEVNQSYTNAQYAFSSQAHVKVASQFFEENHKSMPSKDAHKYASHLQARAAELGMDQLGGAVAKYASDFYSPQVDAQISSRLYLLDGREDLKKDYQKLAAAKSTISPHSFAEVMHGLDKKAGLAKHYGSAVQDPFCSVFGPRPEPYAGWSIKVGNQNLGPEQVRKIVDEQGAKIKEYFGDHLYNELKKDPVAIFDSLPMDAKEIIANLG